MNDKKNNEELNDELDKKNENIDNNPDYSENQLKDESKHKEKNDEDSQNEYNEKEKKEFNPNDFKINFEKEENTNKLSFKNIMLIITVVVIAFIISSYFDRPAEEKEEISYSNFIEKIQTGQIITVEEKGEYLFAQPKAEFNNENKVYKVRMLSNRIAHDENLMKKLEENKVNIRSIEPERMPFIVSVLISWAPILIIALIWFFMIKNIQKDSGNGSAQIFNMGKTKAKSGNNDITITFKDVAGVKEAKEELKEVVEFLREPMKFIHIGAKIPKGVLLLGSPGTGKTLLAKAVAGEAKVPFFSMSGSEFVEMFVGVGASRVRDLFNKAKNNSPCIIFIDEIDAVGRKRGTGHGGGNDEREQTLNQLLVEMDGFGTDKNIIVIAATNRPDVLDSALLRPGRFDRQVVVDRPDIAGREEILKVHVKNKKLAKNVDLKTIAKKTPGFVGADLANLLNEAAILAARYNKKEIEMEDLEEAAEKVMMGPERKSRIMPEKEKINTAYHEVGHALIAYMLPDTAPVHKITIIPRGMSLGSTWQLPEEDKYSESRSSLMNDIKILLGGRAAEEIKFNDITSGASNDIERATKIAFNMVTVYGMGKLGPLRYGMLESEFISQRSYSEDTAKLIDEEINQLINESYKEVKQIILDNIDKLEAVTKVLLEKETINGQELKEIIENVSKNKFGGFEIDG